MTPGSGTASAGTRRRPRTRPGGIYLASAVWDPLTNGVLLFGGDSSAGPSGCTWSWNGSDWTRLSPLHAPSPREHPGLAYDTDLSRVILFGGTSSGTGLNDTWTWNGQDWLPMGMASPPPAFAAGSGWLGAGPTVVEPPGSVVGQPGFVLVETAPVVGVWSLGAAGWRAVPVPNAPAARAGAALGTDYVTGGAEVLMFGGDIGSGATTNETWRLVPTGYWGQVHPATLPPARGSAGLAATCFDPDNYTLLMFGGAAGDGTPLADLWVWLEFPPSGSPNWKQLA